MQQGNDNKPKFLSSSRAIKNYEKVLFEMESLIHPSEIMSKTLNRLIPTSNLAIHGRDPITSIQSSKQDSYHFNVVNKISKKIDDFSFDFKR
jgi:hypothetical protein